MESACSYDSYTVRIVDGQKGLGNQYISANLNANLASGKSAKLCIYTVYTIAIIGDTNPARHQFDHAICK